MTTEQNRQTVLRHVQPEDEAFLAAVYASTRTEELAQVPWSDEQREMFLLMQFAAQQQHYQTYFPSAVHQVIQLGEEPVGRLYVDRDEHKIHILDLTLLPAYRGQGVGSRLILDLLEEAEAGNRAVTIHVESFNRSRGLFERLGFVPVKEQGAHLLFEWRADNQSTSPADGEIK